MEEGTPVGRRVVLGMLGLGALGIWGGARVQDRIASLLKPITEEDPTGISGVLPTGGRFRYYSVTNRAPKRTEQDYRLKVGGLVERSATHTLADLRAMPQTHLTRDFQCVTGWRVAAVPWSGVLLSEVLDRAGVKPGATALRFRSFDGKYSESLTLDQARRPDVLVALEMDGGPVSRDHGGPVRLYVAPMYGYKSIKWLESIEVTDRVVPGYWEHYGYDVDAWVGASNGRDDVRTS